MKKIIRKLAIIYRKIERLFFKVIFANKKRLTLEKISEITGIEVPKEYESLKRKKIKEPTISYKNIKPGCIYYTFRYLNLTDKMKEKISKNAMFVVTPEKIENARCLICKDPVSAGLKTLNYIRNQSKAKVIAVTGSIGKTSTKDMIEACLKEEYKNKMVASAGNSNSAFKAAENVKKLNYNDKILLQEAGAGNGAYDIVKRSALLLEADIAVYTNIKDSHIEWYGSRENIAKEKFTLSDYGKKDGLAIINYDDDILRKHKFVQKRLSFSLNNKKADYYAKYIKVTSKGTRFIIVDSIENKEIPVELKVIGEHHILNALTAYIIGKYLNISEEKIIRGITKYKTKGVRQNLINVGEYKILADCYNSSYDAIKNILKTFELIEIKESARRVAVLGDIFELGNISEQIHRDVGKLLLEHNIDLIIFNGEKMKYAYEEYSKKRKNSIYCKDKEELVNALNKNLQKDDIILFKASHGMNFAAIIDKQFGTIIGEQLATSHKEYKVKKDKKYSFNQYKTWITITKVKQIEEKETLPNEINNLPVEKIGAEIFKDNKVIKEITLNNDLARIFKRCFYGSTIEKINFNKNLKAIGKEAFYSCKNLKEIELPDGLLTIGKYSFAKCKNLKEITIPDSVQKISNYAFYKSNNVVIKGNKNSYAHKYAKDKKIKFEPIK